jgi:hypothetical protein
MQQEGEKSQGKALQKTVEKSVTAEQGKTQTDAEKAKKELESQAEKTKEQAEKPEE